MKRSCRPNFFRACAVIAFMVSVGANTAHAAPANCDGDMSEDQKFQLSLCEAHTGCRLVTALFDSCVGVKGFLGRLGLGGKAGSSRVSDPAVESALLSMGVPQAKLSSCLFSFDRSLCRQYLGLETAAVEIAEPPPKKSRRIELLDMIATLDDEASRARGSQINYYNARSHLENCEYAKDDRKARESVCRTAQTRVDECLVFRQGWYARRATVLGEAGKEGLSTSSITRAELPPCPATLPSSSLTPEQALASWGKKDDDLDTEFSRCEALRRTATAAVDTESPQAKTALSSFETSCAKVHPDFAGVAHVLRGRLTDDQASSESSQPLRRGGGSATKLFNESLADNEAKVRERAAAAERERKAQAAQVAQEQRDRAAQPVVGGAGASTDSRYSSVCARNIEKIEKVGVVNKVPVPAFKDVNDQLIQLLTPCAATSPRDAKNLQDFLRYRKESEASCAESPGMRRACDSRSDAEKASLQFYRSEVNKALSDPNYSADLGTAGPRSTQGGANSTEAAIGGKSGSFEDCKREAEAGDSKLVSAMARLDKSASVQLRGAIVGIDSMIKAYRQCAGDERARKAISELEATRAQALGTCRQIVAIDNCLQSPF